MAPGGSHSPSRSWTRWLIPSLGDLFFIAVMAWLFVCGANGWKSLLGDGDAGWHIRTGEYILRQHAVPTQDLFSFLRPGAPWFAWEWLTDVLYALLYHAGGLKAIVLIAGSLITVFATVLLRFTLWRGANALVALFTTLLAIGGSSMHFLARPHLFTLLLLPVCLWMLEADRRRPTGWVWLLIPITTLWTNLHGGFGVFLACVALLITGTAVEGWIAAPRWPEILKNQALKNQLLRYTALLAGCSAASLINPYGARLHVHIFEYLRSDWIKNLIQEFQAPTFRSEEQLQFEALILGGLVVAGLLLRRPRVTEALWIVFFAHSSLISLRHAPLYAVVAAPLIASELSSGWSAWASRLGKLSPVRILYQMGQECAAGFRHSSVWPVLVVLALAAIDAPIKWPLDFPSELFPTALVHQNADRLEHGRLLTTDQWGDYIIYCFYPRQKVFVDGRSDFYGQAAVADYLHLLQGTYDWREILDRQRFEVALLPVEWPLTSLLKQDPAWRVVADDQHAVLFEHLGPYGPSTK
jgi:hypothetical protein